MTSGFLQQRSSRRCAAYCRGLAVGVLGVLALACDMPWSAPTHTELLDELAVLAQGRRHFEPQLSVGIDLAPCEPVLTPGDPIPEPRCSEEIRPGTEQWDRVMVLGMKLRAAVAREEASAAALHVTGLWHLLWNRASDNTDQAIERLEEARVQAPGDARLLNDLGAAYFLRAQRRDDPRDFFSALEWARRATEIDPKFTAAHYNLALLFERLALPSAAVTAWGRVQAADSRAGRASASDAAQQGIASSFAARWRDNEKALLDAARADDVAELARLVGDFVQPARLAVEEKFLAAWAVAHRDGNRENAQQHLSVARHISEAVAALTGDRLLPDSIAAIRRSLAEPDPASALRLATAHLLYADALHLHRRQQYGAARELFRRAGSGLEAGASPFAKWPELYLAIIDYHAPDYPAARAGLEHLLGRTSDRAPVLRAYALWLLGLIDYVQGDYHHSVDHYQRARTIFDATGQLENRGAMDNHLARVFDRLGIPERAWQHRYAALEALGSTIGHRRISNIFNNVVDSLLAEGRLETAALYQDELVRLSRLADNPLILTVGLRRSAALAHDLGRTADALRALDEAWQESEKVQAPGDRGTNQVEILTLRAQVDRHRDPQASLTALRQALELYTSRQSRFRLVRILREIAGTHLATGSVDEAGAALDAALTEARSLSRELDGAYLASYSETVAPLFENLVEFHLEHRHDPMRAFTYSEQSRAFRMEAALGSMADGVLTRPASPAAALGLADLQRRLGRGRVAVVFESLPEKLYVWLVSETSWAFAAQPISSTELARRVDEVVARFDVSAAAQLHAILFGGFEDGIPPGSDIVVLPDGALHRLPFDVLFDAERQRYLLDDHAVALNPSTVAYTRSMERNSDLRGAHALSVLAVGDPAFDEALYGLPRLPWARREAYDVADLYRPRARVLTRADATRSRFLGEAVAHDVIHFAGHARLDEDPRRSTLLLASDPDGGSGDLRAADVFDVDLSRTRLIVLAACSSARSAAGGPEGFASLALPFLAVGVPNVVASLWPVDDEATAVFSRLFHAYYLETFDALAALHAAKRALRRHRDPVLRSPRSWAAFQLLGSPSDVHGQN